MLQHLFTVAIFAGFSLGFATIWFKNRNFPSAGIWALSYLAAAIAFGFEIVFATVDGSMFLTPAMDALYLIAPLLLAVGLAVRFNRKIPIIPLALVYAATIIPAIWNWYPENNFTLRTEIISYGCAALVAIGAYQVFKRIDSLLDRILFYAVAAFSAQFIVTTVFALYIRRENFDAGSFLDSLYQEMLNFSVTLIAVAMAVLLFANLAVELIEDLRTKSDTDGLTGLNNRRSFEASAIEALESCEKNGQPCSLIICDIDHFKGVNDRFGHFTGDKVIKSLAEILNANCRQADITGRIGGEEFVICLPVANVTMGLLIAEAMRSAFAAAQVSEDHPELRVTASFGVAEVQMGETYRSLLQRADKMLYHAKDSGRNQVHAASIQADGHNVFVLDKSVKKETR